MGPEKTMTEAQLRESTAPSYESMEDLVDYITCLVEREHDYGTCVYAMSLSAVAAFNHVAKKLGVTGFQASCADLDILKRTRGMKGPFMVVDTSLALYPQYDLVTRVKQHIEEQAQWLADAAREKLAEPRDFTHPNVLAYWEQLAAAAPPKEKEDA